MMPSRRPAPRRAPVLLVAALVASLLVVASPTPARAGHDAGVTHDQGAFLEVIGEHTSTGFDELADGTPVTDQVPGVSFSTVPGNSQPYAFKTTGASSAPNLLFGGIPSTLEDLQVLIATFSPPVDAVGFHLASQNPNSTPATVRYTFTDGTSTEIAVSNSSGSEDRPTYLGYQAVGPAVTSIRVTSGREGTNTTGFEEIGLDDLAFSPAPVVDVPLAASRIAFTRIDGGDDDIWVTDEAGANPLNLTADSLADDRDPHLSPDGRRITFTSDRAGSSDIWVMDVDGTNLVNVTPGSAAIDADPAWSPDGTRIAFASDRRGRFDVYVIPATGGGAVRVSNADIGAGSGAPWLDGFPTWSPDGSTIAFRSDRTGNFDIWTTSADGSFTETNLTNHPAEDQEPAWSPDGGTIAFTSDRDVAGDRDLWIMAAGRGKAQKLVVRDGSDEGFPAWAPDGARLVFDSGTGRDRDVFTLARGSGVVEQLTTGLGDDDRAASWSSSLSLSADQDAVLPGASTIDPATIPPTELPLSAAEAVADTPLKSVDIQSSPLKSVPLKSVPLKSVPLKSVPLKSVTLSQIPLKSVGASWEAILAGTPLAGVPLQNVTLEQLLALDPPPAGLASITLSDVDLASTPLKSVSMVSLAMGSTPLKSVPLKSVGTGNAFDSWCTVLATLGYSCAGLGLTEDSPILAVDLAGVPLKSVPLKSVPLKSVPLKSVDVEALPLKSVPLKSVRLDQIQLGGLLLTWIDGGALDSLFTCGNSCPASLGEAYSSQLIEDAATLGMLFDAVDLAQIPEEWDLLNLLQGLVDVEDYPWESLPVEEIGVQDFAPAGAPIVTYDASFAVAGTGLAQPATATVTMPPGFRYVPGSSSTGETAVADPTVAGQTLTWTFPDLSDGGARSWTFEVRPSLRLQDAAPAALGVTVGGAVATAPERAPVTVHEDFEGSGEVAGGTNDTVAGAVPIRANQLVISHIGTPGDVDYFQLPVPPQGTRLQVKLGNNSDDADLDVVLLNGQPADPITSTPLKSVPLKSVPIPDNGLEAAAAGDPVSAETLDDIPGVDLESTPLKSVSQSRSTADELIETVSDAVPGAGDVYFIQVSGFNGASSDAPYVLYVKQYAPPPPPKCAGPRSFPFPSEGVAGAAPTGLSGVETLILTSQERLGDTHGATAAATAMGKLQTLADAPGVAGLVHPIEADADVAAALDAWDADPCSPEKANAVVGAVSGIVEAVRQASPQLRHVVIAGGDDIVPMARVADYTQLSNEDDYTAEVLTDAGAGNPIAAAVATQNILSDDPYGDLDPTPWLDHFLYVPELATGRLVETPADIAAQVDLFLASGGILDPTTALTAGYDFLTDGSDAVDTALAQRLPDSARTKLVNETWTRADLDAALFPSGGSPSIASANAHYDHNRALPALGNSTSDESDLFTVADVTSKPPEALLQRILFTMGCHAGLSVPDSYFDPADGTSDDWVETYLGEDQKAAVYFANTGYGYGDTAAVALSEKLMELFAARLDGSMTVGEAATYAKQAYFGSLGAYGPYDEKAMQEATFYGLPMYRIGSSPVTPPAPPTVTPDGSAVPGVDVSLTLDGTDFEEVTSPAGGTYATVADGTFSVGGAARMPSLGEAQVTQYRPIVPRTSQVVTSADGDLVAKGFLVTDLTSTDRAVIPAVARPVVDLSTNEAPPTVGDVAFPTSFSNISTYRGPGGQEQRLVLLPGQVFRNGGGGPGAVQRLFSEIGGTVTYGSATGDHAAPFLTDVHATVDDANDLLQLSLRATDGGGSTITRVVALVKDESGTWRLVELTGDGSGGYSGSLAVQGTDVEYFVQALDSAGNVGISTNKGRYYLGAPPLAIGDAPDAPQPAVLRPSGSAGGNGWFTGPVEVQIDGQPETTYEVYVDGTKQTTFPGGDAVTDGTVTVTVTGEGAHLVEVKGSDRTRSSLFVPIDQTDPSVSIAGVSEGEQHPTNVLPRCVGSDALSGLASCTITVTGGDASHTVGRLTATATAVDRAGNDTSVSVAYDVGPVFGGFLQPINDTGRTTSSGTSIFKAASTVPVKFQLRDAAGQLVKAATPPVWLTPEKGGKVEGAPNESTSTATATSGTTFTYDEETGTYQYNWRTAKSMAGSYWKIGVDLGHGRVYWTYIGLR